MKIDLQLFAEEPGMDDDLTPDVNDELDIDDIFDIDEDENEDETVTENEEEPEEDNTVEDDSEDTEEEKTEEHTPEHEPKFTQEDINRIIAERLARDRKSQLVKELESLVGMDISGIVDYARQQRVVQKAEELGIPEEDAERILKSEEQMEEAERRMAAYEQQLQAFQSVVLYGQEKSKYLSNPLVKKYEREIDNFARGGLECGFVPAMNYVLGQKVLSGEITKQMQNAAEQKTLANISKRSKIAVEKATGAAPDKSSYLTPQEKQIAARLGLSYKEYAEEKIKLNKK